jgi:hypothetical protein
MGLKVPKGGEGVGLYEEAAELLRQADRRLDAGGDLEAQVSGMKYLVRELATAVATLARRVEKLEGKADGS